MYSYYLSFGVRKVRCKNADWIYVAQDTVKWAAVLSILFLLRSQTFCVTEKYIDSFVIVTEWQLLISPCLIESAQISPFHSTRTKIITITITIVTI